MTTKLSGMPRAVSRRIMKHGAASDEPVVITFRGGKPTRVFRHAEYDKMVELPHRVKPWEHRKRKVETPDPLGAADADAPTGLSRQELYKD